MTSSVPSLAETAKRLRAILQRETDLARRGAITALAEAGEAKRAAFAEFRAACQIWPPDAIRRDADRDALRALLTATHENADVLDAVRVALEGFRAGVRAALEGSVNPGTYSPRGQGRLHLPAARIDASA